MTQPSRWIVSQIGARQHYGIPRGFQRSEALRVLYTDVWWPSWAPHPRWPKSLASLAGRTHSDVPGDKVVSFSLASMARRCLGRPVGSDGIESEYLDYTRQGEWFGRKVAGHLARQPLDEKVDAFFGFNTGCLETLGMLRDRHPKLVTVVDQIDPARVEEELVAEEAQRWPGWQAAQGRIPDAYWNRLRGEWDLASLILVNSNWSKQALLRQGVPAEKLFIVPVAHQTMQSLAPKKTDAGSPFRVLWFGSVNLRKGIPYLVEAAKLLMDRSNIRIDVIGPVQISSEAIASAPSNMTFHGRVPRDQADAAYRRASVLVLPTISDGFAITQIEAMAQGVPVITTSNCGDVVTDGVDGLIIPIRDAAALASAITKLEGDRQLLETMSARAIEKSGAFSFDEQTRLIENAVSAYRAKL